MTVDIIILVLLIITNILMLLYAAAVVSDVKKAAKAVNKNTDEDIKEALTFIYNMDDAKKMMAAGEEELAKLLYDFILDPEGGQASLPSFDITPPHLVSGIVTDRGIFSPYDLNRYFEHGELGEYEMIV